MIPHAPWPLATRAPPPPGGARAAADRPPNSAARRPAFLAADPLQCREEAAWRSRRSRGASALRVRLLRRERRPDGRDAARGDGREQHVRDSAPLVSASIPASSSTCARRVRQLELDHDAPQRRDRRRPASTGPAGDHDRARRVVDAVDRHAGRPAVLDVRVRGLADLAAPRPPRARAARRRSRPPPAGPAGRSPAARRAARRRARARARAARRPRGTSAAAPGTRRRRRSARSRRAAGRRAPRGARSRARASR